jgi:hypothetical protein
LHVIELAVVNAGRAEVCAAAADSAFGFVEGAPKLAGGADLDAATAATAELRSAIEGSRDAALPAAALESDGARHHLLGAHPDATAAKDAVFMLLAESLAVDAHGRSQVLNCLGLRAGC